MLAASENRDISDGSAWEYLPRLVTSHGEDASLVFASNLLPDPKAIDYARLPYENFLALRSEIIHNRMKHLCHGNNTQ